MSDVHADLANLVKQYDLNEFAASVKVYAPKNSAWCRHSNHNSEENQCAVFVLDFSALCWL